MLRRDFNRFLLQTPLYPWIGSGWHQATADINRVKVGILHSLSGTMAMSEKWLKDVALMTIGQINASGGVLGHYLDPVVVDPASNWGVFATKAGKLIQTHSVPVIFGCWTSVSRKQVVPVVEAQDALLFYPVQYEGQEQSPNVFYTGGTPSQQSLPAIQYLLRERGVNLFVLLGTDYVYPRTTNRLLRAYLKQQGIGDAGLLEIYVPFSHTDYRAIIKRISAATAGKNAVIVSTINGDSNVAFYAELAAAGLTADRLPVVAFSIGEQEIQPMTRDDLAGHYAAWNYFMALDNPINHRFIHDWQQFARNKYPWLSAEAVTNDPMEATYVGIHLWKQAVEQAGSFAAGPVRSALGGQVFEAPSGYPVRMDQDNHHLHKPFFLGRIQRNGQFEIVHRSAGLIPPDPWSPYLDERPIR